MDESGALPLTSKNLNRLPDASRQKSASTITLLSDPSNRFPSSGSDITTILHEQSSRMQEILRDNHMIYQPLMRHLDPAVNEVVRRILSKGPFKRMSSKQAARIVRKTAGRRNGATYFFLFAQEMFKDSYQIEDPDKPGQWVTKEWRDQWLDFTVSQDFDQEAVPPLKLTYRYDGRLLASVPRVEHPRPDMVFGLCNGLIRYPISWERHFWSWEWIAPGVSHPFLLVEFDDNTLRWAAFQAQRSGSALVAAKRKLQVCAGMALPNGSEADVANIVFSFVMTHCLAELNVHWARVSRFDKTTKYMMTNIRNYHLPNFGKHYGDIKDFRHDLECILSWGTTDRMAGPEGITAMLERIKQKAESESSGPEASGLQKQKRKNSGKHSNSRKVARWMKVGGADAEDWEMSQSTDPLG